jgi:hypothetical protein
MTVTVGKFVLGTETSSTEAIMEVLKSMIKNANMER